MNDATPYQLLGGEAGVRELVERFYDHMDAEPAVKDVRALHAASLRASRDKLFLFLSGWLGGPDLYVERFGHPRLRQRHLPFAIDSRARDQWMQCMQMALADMAIDETLQTKLLAAFRATADHMRNKADFEPHDDLPTGG